MHRQLTLKVFKAENGWDIEYTGSGSTPTTYDYLFNNGEDVDKKLIEILSGYIREKLVKKSDAEAIVRSLIGAKGETYEDLTIRLVDKLREIREL